MTIWYIDSIRLYLAVIVTVIYQWEITSTWWVQMHHYNYQLAQVASDVEKAIFFKNKYFTSVLNRLFDTLNVNQLVLLLLNR